MPSDIPVTDLPLAPIRPATPGWLRTALLMLWRDKFALVSAIFLVFLIFCAVLGPILAENAAATVNLRLRNAAPFSLDRSWLFFLGADSLGRPILARLAVGSGSTLAVAASAVACALVVGVGLGLVAGYRGGWVGTVIMRLADILMSFPSLLLALVVLYVFSANLGNLVLVLAVTRVPLFLRTTRAEVLELRERMFVTAAQVLGARPRRIVGRHLLPMLIPTLLTVTTLEFAFVMLSESSLSFLGFGIQAPGITWGLMVSEGRNYLGSAWWIAFWPGLAIALTTVSLNLFSNWVRVATDPVQRWRLEARSNSRG